MMITKNARAALEKPLGEETAGQSRQATSISELEGNTCITRVFRASGGRKADDLVDEWSALVFRQFQTRDAEIDIQRFRLPGPDGEGTIVAAISHRASDSESGPQPRSIHTPQGVRVTQHPGEHSRVAIHYESGLMGRVEG